MTQVRGVTGIVLAGGASSRFGSDKLAARIDGRPLLQRAIDAVAPVSDEIVVVIGQGSEPSVESSRPVRMIRDSDRFPGPRAGLLAGVEAAAHPLAVVAGGDMPWIRPAVLRALLDRLDVDERGAAAPILYGILQPLPCAVRVAAVRAARGHRRGSLLALLEAAGVAPLAELAWRDVDPAGASLQDVDRPEDLAGPADLPLRGWVATWAKPAGRRPLDGTVAAELAGSDDAPAGPPGS